MSVAGRMSREVSETSRADLFLWKRALVQ